MEHPSFTFDFGNGFSAQNGTFDETQGDGQRPK
jgi:hypothetical protein